MIPGATLFAMVGLLSALAPSASASLRFDLKWGSLGSGDGQFNTPYGIATDSSDNVYVADTLNHRIEKFSSAGSLVSVWGWGVQDGTNAYETCTSSCQAGISGSGDGQFNTPEGIAIDSSDNVYVTDSQNNRIEKFSSAGSFTSTWGWGVQDGTSAYEVCTSSCQAGIGSGQGDGQLFGPLGIATDSSDNVYVADYYNDRIEKFSSGGAFLTKWGSSGSGAAQFFGPANLATDSSNNVYVTDFNNARIEKFSSGGAFMSTWGWGVQDGASAYEICTSSCQAGIQGSGDGQFYYPTGIAIDSTDGVYVSEFVNNRVDEFSPLGSFLDKSGSSGSGDGRFSAPFGVATDSSDNVYVAENGNNRVQKFQVEPNTAITSGPAGATNDSTPTFGFSSTRPGSTFECRFDSSAFAPCSGPGAAHTPASALSDGSHTFEVRATSQASITDPSPATRSFTVDTVRPDTTINSGPAAGAKTKYSTPTFGFSSNDPGATFECRFDAGAFAPCSGPGATHTPASPLSDGSHTVYVRAKDQAQNVDTSPASRSFTVDATPPAVTIDSGPSGPTGDATPTFMYSSNEPSYFLCRFDSHSYKRCAPAHAMSGSRTASPALSEGLHAFGLKVRDLAGNVVTLSRSFAVDTTPPVTTITSGPSGSTKDRTPTFSFHSSEPGSTFACSLDGATPTPCSSPKTLATLSFGAHTFRIRAKDAAGNADSTPSVRRFTVTH